MGYTVNLIANYQTWLHYSKHQRPWTHNEAAWDVLQQPIVYILPVILNSLKFRFHSSGCMSVKHFWEHLHVHGRQTNSYFLATSKSNLIITNSTMKKKILIQIPPISLISCRILGKLPNQSDVKWWQKWHLSHKAWVNSGCCNWICLWVILKIK